MRSPREKTRVLERKKRSTTTYGLTGGNREVEREARPNEGEGSKKGQ